MSNIFVETNFARNWMQWTNRGTAHISIGDKISEPFPIVSGVGQGDSSSSSKYIIMHQVFIAALLSPKMSHLLFKLDDGSTLEPLTFAHDTVACMQFRDENDVILLRDAFQCIGETTGLFINLDKTAILAAGEFPKNINVIGKIEDSAKHLGVYLSLNHNTAYRLTYEYAIGRMKNKAAQIFFFSQRQYSKKKIDNIYYAIILRLSYYVCLPPMPKRREGDRQVDS